MIDLLVVPRFNMSSITELKEPLEKLGVMDLFDEQKANLSGSVSTLSYLILSEDTQ